MRTSTSFAALVALMAVAGSAAPIGARTFPAPAPVPDNHSTPSKDSGSIITIPNPLCGNCHDDTVKNVPDHSKSAEDTIKAVVDIGKNGGHVIDVVPNIHADVDIGGKEHHEQPPKNESKPPMNNQKPPQNDQKPPHDDSDIKVDVKADVKDEIKADVYANVKDVVETNVSVNDPKGGKHDEVKDTTKNVKDGAKGPAPDAHDIVAEVKADLGKVVGDGGIVSLGQKPKQDADCDDLLKVGGKPVVSSSLLRRFSSRILPQGWVA